MISKGRRYNFMTWLSLLIPQHITFHHIMAFLGTIKFVIKRWNNDDFRWEVKGWTITEKRSFQYHDYNAHQKNPIIKLVSDRSTGREISCFENVYDESQLWGCHRPLSIIIHISILHDLFWFSYSKNHWLSTCQVSHVMSLFFFF